MAADRSRVPVPPRARLAVPSRARRFAPAVVTLLVAASIAATAIAVLSERPHAPLLFRAAWLAPAIVGFLALHVVQAELWRRLLARLGGPLSPRRGLAIWSVSTIARYVPTSMLMPVLRVTLSGARGAPRAAGIASIAYEALLAIGGALCVAAYFVVGLPALRGEAWRWGAVAIPLLVVIGLHPRVLGALSGRLLRRLGREPLRARLALGALLSFTAGYAASFVLGGASLLALACVFDRVGWPDAPSVVGAFSVGFVASTFAFVLPAGLGAREAALVAALAPVMPGFAATAVAVSVRLVQLSVELLFALLAPRFANRHERRAAGTAAAAAVVVASPERVGPLP